MPAVDRQSCIRPHKILEGVAEIIEPSKIKAQKGKVVYRTPEGEQSCGESLRITGIHGHW